MISVMVNDETRTLPDGITVAGLVAELGCGRRGVAVAVNAEVVARSAWDMTEVVADDRIEVLRAVQGGCT